MENLREPSATVTSESEPFEDTLRFVQLTRGSGALTRERFERGGSALHVQRFAQGVQIRAAVPAGRVVVGSILEGRAPFYRNGAPWRPGEAVAFLRGSIDVCTHASCTVAWLETDRSHLALPPFDSGGGEAAALSFRELSGPFGLARAERDPVSRALWNATRGLAHAAPSAKTGAARYEFARSVEELMWQNVDALLSLDAIGRLTARSPRSVHHAFTSSFGFGPLSYFKILRLNAVRARLADPSRNATVIDVAAEYGFWHLGHFGTSYKLFFGETPSQTRRFNARPSGSASQDTGGKASKPVR